MSEAWDAWLAECLGGLNIDADVFGPYVTGIMVRRTLLARRRIRPARIWRGGPPRAARLCGGAAIADRRGWRAGGRDAAGG